MTITKKKAEDVAKAEAGAVAKSGNFCICYNENHYIIVKKHKEKAKGQNRSFSNYIINLLEDNL